MTKVLVSLTVPSPDGVNVPDKGWMSFVPTKRRLVDEHIVVPKPFTIKVNGPTLVILAPNSIDWCWTIEENVSKHYVRHVNVPETEEIVHYHDLVDIDPETFEPSVGAIPAWEAAVTKVREYADDVAALIPLMESTVGAASAVHQEALLAIGAAEEAAAHVEQAGQHRAAAELAAAHQIMFVGALEGEPA